MHKCSFCGAKEEVQTPVCQSCGALKYPVPNDSKSSPTSRRQKLKLSATVATALVTPGAFVVLAFIGANRLKTKFTSKKNKRDD